ncbi:MAG: GNAT family N-acetyltransferase [Cyclobacteriaceae bacterium]
MEIRKIKKQDIDQLIGLCRDHAHFEGVEYHANGVADRLGKHLFCESPVLTCYVVEDLGELVGYITYTREFATWTASYFYHMDCLYLKEGYRKSGLGKRLMTKMTSHARANNIDLIQWQTPDSNTNAIDFYHHIGATSKAKQRFFLEI